MEYDRAFAVPHGMSESAEVEPRRANSELPKPGPSCSRERFCAASSSLAGHSKYSRTLRNALAFNLLHQSLQRTLFGGPSPFLLAAAGASPLAEIPLSSHFSVVQSLIRSDHACSLDHGVSAPERCCSSAPPPQAMRPDFSKAARLALLPLESSSVLTTPWYRKRKPT